MGLRKGMTNNPKGKPLGAKNQRTVEWERLGEFMTVEGATRAKSYLLGIKDDAEFFERYMDLLNYFKPRMAQSQVETIGNDFESVSITFVNESKG